MMAMVYVTILECTGQITINIVEDEDYTADYTVFISSQLKHQMVN